MFHKDSFYFVMPGGLWGLAHFLPGVKSEDLIGSLRFSETHRGSLYFNFLWFRTLRNLRRTWHPLRFAIYLRGVGREELEVDRSKTKAFEDPRRTSKSFSILSHSGEIISQVVGGKSGHLIISVFLILHQDLRILTPGAAFAWYSTEQVNLWTVHNLSLMVL